MTHWAHDKPGDTAAMSLELREAPDGSVAGGVTIEQQVERHFQELRNKIYVYLVALGASPADAEDITQEAFIRLCQQLVAKVEIVNVRAWLFRTARNLQLDDYRSWRAKALVSEMDLRACLDFRKDLLPDPEAQAIAHERSERLKNAMRGLTQNQAAYLHLRAEGLRYREIAEIYGISISTVVDVVRRAVERLGKEVQ